LSVKTGPSSPVQSCTVSQGGGNVAGAPISNIKVDCTTNKYSISGTVSGLDGTLVLANGTTTKTMTSNGEFTFADIDSGTEYNIVVQTPPSGPTQDCTVTGGQGTIVNQNIEGVSVVCVTRELSIGGTVTGLIQGGTIQLKNGSELKDITADGTFTFDTKQLSGTEFTVTMTSSPNTQRCNLTGATGTLGAENVTTVKVNCSTLRTLSGTVSGLNGSTGLKLANGTDTVDITADGTFTFEQTYPDGDAYLVEVSSPATAPWQDCIITNGSGTFSDNVSDVQVVCTKKSFNLNVNVTGLVGSGLVLENNDGSAAHNLAVTATGISTFTDKVVSGSSYTVSVLTPPTTPTQTCEIASSTGTVGGTDITLLVTCTTTTYTVGGTVAAGYVTGMVLQDNEGDDLSISSTGTFTFATKVASGKSYAVTIKTSPAGTNCAVYGGSGTVTNANITSVYVTCSPPYNFDFNTQGWYTNAAPTGLTLAWADAISSTPGGGSLQVNWPAAPGTGYKGFQIGVSVSPALNLSWATTMSLKIRIDGATPASNNYGQFELYVQDSVGAWQTGPTATPWYLMTLGQWYAASSPLPASGIDFTKISGFGLNIYINDQALMQATTIYIDSVTFE
jgi:hypothetical protein